MQNQIIEIRICWNYFDKQFEINFNYFQLKSIFRAIFFDEKSTFQQKSAESQSNK